MNKIETPILSFVANPKANQIQQNPYGHARIDVWCFNFDGDGSALITTDNDPDFSSMGGKDLNTILCGDPESGTRWYRRVSESQGRIDQVRQKANRQSK